MKKILVSVTLCSKLEKLSITRLIINDELLKIIETSQEYWATNHRLILAPFNNMCSTNFGYIWR